MDIWGESLRGLGPPKYNHSPQKDLLCQKIDENWYRKIKLAFPKISTNLRQSGMPKYIEKHRNSARGVICANRLSVIGFVKSWYLF